MTVDRDWFRSAGCRRRKRALSWGFIVLKLLEGGFWERRRVIASLKSCTRVSKILADRGWSTIRSYHFSVKRMRGSGVIRLRVIRVLLASEYQARSLSRKVRRSSIQASARDGLFGQLPGSVIVGTVVVVDTRWAGIPKMARDVGSMMSGGGSRTVWGSMVVETRSGENRRI